jgi:hypothetical protein
MDGSRDRPESRDGTDSAPRARDIHDNLTSESAIGPRDRNRGQDMRSSTIDAARRTTGANPIRWSGWLAGLAISLSLWIAIYLIWNGI